MHVINLIIAMTTKPVITAAIVFFDSLKSADWNIIIRNTNFSLITHWMYVQRTLAIVIYDDRTRTDELASVG